jgi:WD40 repeat protein
MGPHCDACHDLGEEGQAAAPAWLDPRRATLLGEEGRTLFLAFGPDGLTLAAGTGRDHVTLWDTATGLERGRLVCGPEDWLLGVGWVDDGQRLVTADANGLLRYWSAKTGLPTGEQIQIGTSECFAVSPEGVFLGRGNRTGISLLSASDGKVSRNLESNLPGVFVLTFSQDGKLIAAGSRHGTVAVWETGSGKERGRLEEVGALITSLAFAPDEQTLAVGLHPAPGSTAAEACRVLLWDVDQRQVQRSLPGHPGGTRSVAFAPDGRMLASGGEDGLIRLWDVHSGQERVAVEWHLDCVSAVAFAPDGMTLASAGFDGVIKLWPREVLRPPTRTHQRGAMVG